MLGSQGSQAIKISSSIDATDLGAGLVTCQRSMPAFPHLCNFFCIAGTYASQQDFALLKILLDRIDGSSAATCSGFMPHSLQFY